MPKVAIPKDVFRTQVEAWTKRIRAEARGTEARPRTRRSSHSPRYGGRYGSALAVLLVAVPIVACEDTTGPGLTRVAFQEVVVSVEWLLNFYGFSCGLTSDGRAMCWGVYPGLDDAVADACVHPGFEPPTEFPCEKNPEAIRTDLRFAKLVAGASHICALDAEGLAYCWGANDLGQLGDGTRVDHSMPQPVAGALRFATIDAGFAHTCGVTTEGAGYCWGGNRFGQVGDGTDVDRERPEPVAADLRLSSISAGGAHTCAITDAEEAYCWGNGDCGQLGTGSGSLTPVPVSGGLTFREVTTGAYHTCGLSTDGVTYCWGENEGGALGINLGIRSSTEPQPVRGDLQFRTIDAGLHHNCAVTHGGQGFCWGLELSGELGDGPDTPVCPYTQFQGSPCSAAPVSIAGNLNLVQVSTGTRHACGVTEAGAAYCWGRNMAGELGNGTTEREDIPSRVR